MAASNYDKKPIGKITDKTYFIRKIIALEFIINHNLKSLRNGFKVIVSFEIPHNIKMLCQFNFSITKGVGYTMLFYPLFVESRS